jgi:predicted amidohydrolase YtcJ
MNRFAPFECATIGRYVLLSVGLLAGAGCASERDPADLVLRGGTITTMDPSRPRAEALAAKDGRIVAIGSVEEVAPYIGEGTRVVELSGRFAYPGFIEAHGHLTGLGRSRRTLDVSGARTWDEVVALVEDEAAKRPAGSWILGWGWDGTRRNGTGDPLRMSRDIPSTTPSHAPFRTTPFS